VKADISTIVGVLSHRRVLLGLTQKEVAAQAGITQSYLSAVERGKLDVRLSTLQDIARALHSDIAVVPLEVLPVVQGMLGHNAGERRLFNADAD
jgi:predicted transcriptional regulator